MNEPEYRIENGRKIYEMTTTIGCARRPDNVAVDPASAPDDTVASEPND